MHHSMRYKLARTVAFGGVMVLGLGSAQAAMASPVQTNFNVPCSTSALNYALANASDGENIILAPTCTYWLSSALPNINTDLTILGNGATLRRGNNADSFTILSVTSDVGVNISSLSFVNGGGPENSDGGAIYSDDGAYIAINGGVFKGNTSYAYGGAIYNGEGTLSVRAATFIGNSAGYGGAIYNDDYTYVTGGKFIGNRALYYDTDDAEGGAIYNDSYLGVATSTFSGNSSEDVGGAIYNEGGTASLIYDGLSYNSADDEGGGIFVNEGTVNVTTSSITENHAGDTGGGILNDDGTVNLTGDYIHANQPNNCTPSISGCND